MCDGGARLLSKNDLSPGSRGQFTMTTDKVSVQVRFDHVLDRQSTTQIQLRAATHEQRRVRPDDDDRSA